MKRFPALLAIFTVLSVFAWTQTTPAKPISPARPTPPAAAVSTNPVAVINTTVGKLTCTLFEKQTPVTVANFIGLATGAKDWKNPASKVTKHGVPLYDGTIFHRVIPDFMIQGGDPAGNGAGDPGYSFKDEFVLPALTFDRPGRLAMANSGPNTNGSQFFITEVPTPHLNGRHTIFGQCDDASVALVKQIARMGRDPSNDRPFHPVKIIHITIVRGGTTAARHTTSTRSTAAKAGTTVKPSTTKPAAKPAIPR